uniref:Uncharacterized protein n=1 Tax=Anopheles maculatus TaxID=74869 RepID=A0A182SAR4_9DIPT
MCTAKEALYLEHMLRVDTMGRLVTGGSKKPGAGKLQHHQLTTIPTTRTELVGHNELGVKNGHGHRAADLTRTRLQDALLEEELKRSNRFCEQQNRLNKLKSSTTGGSDFDLCRQEQDRYLVVPKPASPPSTHLWSSLKVPKKIKGNDKSRSVQRRPAWLCILVIVRCP